MIMGYTRSILIFSSALTLGALGLSACSGSTSNAPAWSSALMGACPQTQKGGDDYTGGGSAYPKGIYTDTNNRAWAVGTVTLGGSQPDIGVIRTSDDNGQTWTEKDKSTGPSGLGASDNAIVVRGSHIYVAQSYKVGDKIWAASIHYSDDSGTTWKKDVPFQLKSGNNESLKSVTLAANGQPFFAGNSGDGSNKTGFVITLVDGKAALVNSRDGVEYNQIAFQPQGNKLLVAGSDLQHKTWFLDFGDIGEQEVKWHALGTTDKGVFTQDSFPSGLGDKIADSVKRLFSPYDHKNKRFLNTIPNFVGSSNSIAVTSDGLIYRAGYLTKEDGTLGTWVTQQSLDGGKTFAVSDAYREERFQSASPNFLYDIDNHMVAIGRSYVESSQNGTTTRQTHWQVRVQFKNRGSNWIPLSSLRGSNDTMPDSDAGTQGTVESTQAVAASSVGSAGNQVLLVLGETKEGNVHHWQVQRVGSCYRPGH